MTEYTADFYRDHQDRALSSAHAIVPILLELVAPRTVVDVGCGSGAWLSVFLQEGIEDVLGLDGDYVDEHVLLIPADRFRAADLTKPLKLGLVFDLVVSLEVAEHLPEESVDSFVDTLVDLGPVVVFSAAIPFQGGVHHVNEQWPAYWAERFADRGYEAIDCIRSRVWDNEDVEWWYAQNIVVYVNRDLIERYPRLLIEMENSDAPPRSLVHPRKYLEDQTSTRSLYRAAEDIAALVPAGASFISVDDGSLGGLGVAGRLAIPFGDTEGLYTSLSPDDETAIHVFEQQRAAGASYAVLYSTAFWWWEQLAEFRMHVRAKYPCLLNSDHLIIFDLTDGERSDGG